MSRPRPRRRGYRHHRQTHHDIQAGGGGGGGGGGALFTQASTLVPPRGGRIELSEIRPVRPNQDIIIPTMLITGRSMRLESKERSLFRTRNGFAQSDGVTQYSGAAIHRKRLGSSPAAAATASTTAPQAANTDLSLFSMMSLHDRLQLDNRETHSSPPPTTKLRHRTPDLGWKIQQQFASRTIVNTNIPLSLVIVGSRQLEVSI